MREYPELVGGELVDPFAIRFHIPDEPILKSDANRLDEKSAGVVWRAEAPTGHIRFEEWRVVKTTPRGFWIKPVDSFLRGAKKTWRSRTTRFCAETRRKALMQLLRRKRAYVRHAERRVVEARTQEAVAQRAWEQGKGSSHE